LSMDSSFDYDWNLIPWASNNNFAYTYCWKSNWQAKESDAAQAFPRDVRSTFHPHAIVFIGLSQNYNLKWNYKKETLYWVAEISSQNIWYINIVVLTKLGRIHSNLFEFQNSEFLTKNLNVKFGRIRFL